MFKRISLIQSSWICFIEFTLYLPLTSIFLHRFLKFRKRESWKTNTPLRMLWYAQLVLLINLPLTAVVFVVYGIQPKGRAQDIVGCVRHIMGQAWFYLFAIIQLLNIILIDETVLACRKKSAGHLKYYYYGFLIPLALYLLNIPHLLNHGKPPIVLGRNTHMLSNAGAIMVVLMSLFCTFWLVREFTKLIQEINKHEYAKLKNVENVRSWNVYLTASILIALGIFIYTTMHYLDELFKIGIMTIHYYDKKEDGYMPYVLSRFINTVLKYILSCILVFLSPYTSLKVKSRRRNTEIGTKPGKAHERQISTSEEEDIEGK